MSTTSIILPVPFHVEHKKPGARAVTSRKTYNEATFEVPSYSTEQVKLVAQWSQPWHDLKQSSLSELVLSSHGWAQTLAHAEHMVALVSVDGKFYAPVRAVEREGAAQYVITPENVSSILHLGLKTVLPFNSCDLHPQHMGFNFRTHGVGNGQEPFEVAGLPEGQVMVTSNEQERIEQMSGFMEKNFIVVDGVLFCNVEEPRIVVRPLAEHVSVRISVKDDDISLVPLFSHYFRIDDAERAFQLIEDGWPGLPVVAHFSDMKVFDPDPLSADSEIVETLRLVRRFYERLGSSLKEMDWSAAEPWYELKKLLSASAPTADELEQMVFLVGKAVDALRNNTEVDADWRDKAVVYGHLGVERWAYRPISLAGPKV